MPQLDPRSLIFVSSLFGLLCSAILLVLRRSFPSTIEGLSHWGLGSLSAMVASFLFGLRGVIPGLFSIVVANGALVGGFMLIYAGLQRFFGRKPSVRLLVSALTLVVCISAWLTFIHPNYPARVMLLTASDAVLLFASAWLVFNGNRESPAGRFTALAFLLTASVSVARFIGIVFELAPATGLFDTSPLHKIYLASFAFAVLTITIGLMMMANDRLRATLEYIAAHDGLSGVYSRSTFIKLLGKELARSRRHARPLALLMFDLDHFKSINDRFGHLVGDRVIVDFSRRTEEMLRQHDYLGRYGGEEFVALLPEASLEEARMVAKRICASIAAGSADDVPRYTVSIGVAAAGGDNADLDTLLGAADKALYLAKTSGRNRVMP